MGTFTGHMIPSILLVNYALLNLINYLKLYYKFAISNLNSLEKTESKYQFKILQKNKIKKMEIYMKIVFPIIGIIGEIVTAFDNKWKFVATGNLQHVTMYFYYSVWGLVEIWHYHKNSNFN